jgi:hypothetical protein
MREINLLELGSAFWRMGRARLAGEAVLQI